MLCKVGDYLENLIIIRSLLHLHGVRTKELWYALFTPVIKWHNSSHTSCPVQVPGGDSVQELGKLGKDTGSLYTSFATSFGSNKFLKKGGKKKKKD